MRSSIRLFLATGFLLSLVIITGLFFYALSQFEELKQSTSQIVNKNNLKTEHVIAMVTSARERVLDMYAMTSSDDPFIRDDLFMNFNSQATKFINARNALLRLKLSEKEKVILEEQGTLTAIALPLQNEVINLIQQDKIAKARQLLNEKGVAAQNHVLLKLGSLLELQQEKNRKINQSVDKRYEESRKLITGWAITAYLISFAVALLTYLSISRAEHTLFDEMEKARATLISIHDVILRINQNGLVIYANKIADEVFGMNVEGRSVSEILPFISVIELFDENKTSNPSLGLFNLEVVDNRLWIEVVQETIYNEKKEIIGKVLVIHDQTEIINAQNRLQAANFNLEKRVEERTANLQQTNEQLQESLASLAHAQDQLVQSEKMAALGSLVAGVSHEINTPIGIAVTSATTIEEKMKNLHQSFLSGDLTKTDFEDYISHTRKGLDILVSNLNRASELIRSFKQVAVDQSSDEKRKINLKSYMDEIILSLHPKLKHSGVIISNKVPDNIEIFTHPGAIYQIMSNLIMNSLIHAFDNKSDEAIYIEATLNNQSLNFIYKDNGKGLDESHLGKIFDPFFTTRRGQGGSGLGMNVVYNLVTATLKGKISASSKPGQGLEISIDIPVNLTEDETV